MTMLSGKVALVTGAASGIGREIAVRLYADGARLMLADLDPMVHEVARQIGTDSHAFDGDLSQETVVAELIQTTLKAFGSIAILVNNAGGGVIRPFLEHTPETLRQTVDRNLWTALWCCYFTLPAMREAGWGRVINVGADSVRNGLAEHAAYNAAKGGVHALTTGLAREFAREGITVNTVAPCMVATPMVQKLMAEGSPWIRQFSEVIPMGRPAEMAEVASMVAYLAGDDAAFVTGQVISVNGGSTML